MDEINSYVGNLPERLPGTWSSMLQFQSSLTESRVIVLVVVGILILLTAVLLFIFRKKIRDVLAKRN